MKTQLIAILLAVGFLPSVLMLKPAQAQEVGLVYYGIQVETLEVRRGDEGENVAAWDLNAFIGPDEYKIRLLSEGEYDLDASQFETLETQLVGEMPISDFFDIKAGIRLDAPKGPNRWYGVLGISGLAQQWVEIDTNMFLSDQGDMSARFGAEYELLLTNRLILTPTASIDLAFSDDAEIEIQSGFTSIELGLRLSYDVVERIFSPYIGFTYETKLGDTKDAIAAEGEDTAAWFIVVGAKFLF
jgi:copper resistance protein B